MKWSQVVWCLLIAGISATGCSTPDHQRKLTIIWKVGQAVGFTIRPFEGDKDALNVLLTTSTSSIYGRVTISGDSAIFEPLIPFTPGIAYRVELAGSEIGRINIPKKGVHPPNIEGIFPMIDSVPENLLKIHIAFSQPMREGQSAEKVHLLNSNGDTMKHTFLFLKTELWNKTHDTITMWLDPGRIKRGLQPNESIGSPLEQGNKYDLIIDSTWQNLLGNTLTRPGRKYFYATARDSISPVPTKWRIIAPRQPANPLYIVPDEVVDEILVSKCLHITDAKGEIIDGDFSGIQRGASIVFVPNQLWTPGSYYLKIENRLEDLAGNNINRPFDRDIKHVKANNGAVTFIKFEVIN